MSTAGTAPLDRDGVIRAAPRIAAIHADAFADTGERAWSETEIAALAARPSGAVFADGEGFIVLDIVADEAEILTLAVARRARRQGLGSKILETALNWLYAQAATRCFLEVAADNTNAISLYRRTGFEPISRRAGYYRREHGQIDAILMQNLLRR